jgi:HK97 family phage portal protein
VRVLGLEIRRALKPVAARRDGGGPVVIREPFTGAWQSNAELTADGVFCNPVLFACLDLIAREIGKMRLRLVQRDAIGIWHETTNPAYTPVLRRPNRYQTTQKFVECWILSKCAHGNAYILKERDARGVVKALYPLDPARVSVLVSDDGGVYYELAADVLKQVPRSDTGGIVVPASEIIHDPMVLLWSPLIGVSPITACGATALQALSIQQDQSTFFANGARPSGVLKVPGALTTEKAAALKQQFRELFSGANSGNVAVLTDGMLFEPMRMNAVDTQLIDQLKLSGETICACYHVPFYMVNQGAAPANLDAESLVQLFYSQCLQSLTTAFETSLDAGLELADDLGTEFDIDDLIWMNSDVRTRSAKESIGSGALSPDEARAKYFGLGPVPGGASPYMQQQYFSLEALAARDAAAPAPATGTAADAMPADVKAAPALEGGSDLADYAARTRAALLARRERWIDAVA